MAKYIPRAPIRHILKEAGIERVSDEIVEKISTDIENHVFALSKRIRAILIASDVKTAKVRHLKAAREME